MEIYRKLTLLGQPDRLTQFVEDAASDPAPRWSRDNAFEAEYCGPGRVSSGVIPFRFDGTDLLPSGTLLLDRPEPGRIDDLNFLADDRNSLEYRQYNSILEDFRSRVVEPRAERLGIRSDLTPDEFSLTPGMSEATAEKLRSFSSLAKKQYGAALPHDQRRWLDFVIAAHRERCQVPARVLERWLLEVGGWEPEVAQALAGQYAFGLQVLTHSSELSQSA